MQDNDQRSYPLLVIDDDVEHGEAATGILRDFGWDVTFRDSGHGGLEWLNDQINAVVLCDYEMPMVDGLDVLKSLDHSRFSFVMLTGNHAPDVVAEALRQRAADYSFKPVHDWNEVDEKLRRVASQVKSRVAAKKEAMKLAQMADWQAWKAGFLKHDQEKDMQDLLRMLHVQFNQDANFHQILDLLEEVASGDVTKTMRVKIPVDVLNYVVSALRPVATLSDGIGIAAALMGDVPRLASMLLGDFTALLKREWTGKWEAHAKKRGHELKFWFDPVLGTFARKFVHIDRASTLKALNELMVNAFKHSDAGSSVRFALTGDANSLAFTITNVPSQRPVDIGNGEFFGLPREFEPQAFRLFFTLRNDAPLTIYEEDWPMGLGLPLVRAVVLGAGGNVTVRNETWHLSDSPEPQIAVTARVSIPLHAEPIADTDTVEDAEDVELF